ISTALTMTYAGARGQTASEMRKTLRYSLEDDALHTAFGKLASKLTKKKKGHEMAVANALWTQKGSHVLEPFAGLLKKHYGAGRHEVDFIGKTEKSRKKINEWVEGKTKDRIKDLLAKGVLTPYTRLVLTNAIYFKGEWKTKVEKDSTREETFRVSGDSTSKIQMMHMGGKRFRYVHRTDQGQPAFSMIEMPYEGGHASMIVILPDDPDRLPGLEKSLTRPFLDGCISSMYQTEIDDLAIPRFRMTSEFSLGNALIEMGMPTAFSDAADFSGINGSKDLSISAVIHKAFVEVNEEGTEAAAATAVVMSTTSVKMPVFFRADHPFLFLIRDTATGAILFMGRMADPSA
ncbi:MAG: serpin family protein, partial [Deltaproteobacteria bacterium]|nr:serpin family protein [Deltaproteobacteria bacterium]